MERYQKNQLNPADIEINISWALFANSHKIIFSISRLLTLSSLHLYYSAVFFTNNFWGKRQLMMNSEFGKNEKMDSPLPALTSPAEVEAEAEAKRNEREKEMLHKTKVVQFLGRTTPIILQNDNGPCPLLAICKFSFLSL